MSWPLSHEFNEAVQNPQLVFSDPELRTCEAVVGARGIPLPRSGNFADVYQLHGADLRDWAVKCFTRPVTGLGARYAAISEALTRAALPFTVNFSYLAEGIQVGGAWRPVVKMEWVEGLLLNQVARENAARPAILASLAQMWSKLCKRLRDSGVAHADLQHGNILLVPGSRPGAYGLKLIDYDGMYVPALANQPSGEVGHPSFQHPARATSGTYSPDVDRFPHLVIATALKGLEVSGQALWERYDTGDNLLFLEADFKKPAASKLMRELWQTEHPALQALVGRLAVACTRPIPQTPWLDQIAPEGEVAPLDNETRRAALDALGLAPVVMALPPEPTELPASAFEMLDAKPAPLPPATAPPQSRTQPASPTRTAVPAPEVDVELVDQSPRQKAQVKEREKETAKKRKYQRPLRPDEEPAKSYKRLFVIGGVILLLGGVVAGVMLSSKKPEQIAEVIPDEPKDPVPKKPVPRETKPKETKPKEKDPDSVVPPKKDNSIDPPIIGDPVVGVPKMGQITIRERAHGFSSLTLPQEWYAFDGDSKHAFMVFPGPFRATVFDIRTAGGRGVTGFPQIPDGTHFVVFSQQGNQVALWVREQQTVTVFDTEKGKVATTIDVPELPAPTDANADREPIVRISPNARYIVSARKSAYGVRPGGTERGYLPAPFRLRDTTTKKDILSFDWMSGAVFFAADSSRVLVIDAYASARWYKLPGGEPDGEWKFGDKMSEHAPLFVEDASSDGRVVLCRGSGGLQGKENAYFILNGNTGAVVSVLGKLFEQRSGHLTADGQLVSVLDNRDPKGDAHLVLLDTATGAEVGRKRLPALAQPAITSALSPDGRYAFVSGRWVGGEHTILFELVRPEADVAVKPIDPLPGVAAGATPASPAPSEVNLKEPRKISIDGGGTSRVLFDYDGNSLVLMGGNNHVLSINLRTGNGQKLVDLPKANTLIPTLIPQPGGRLVTWAVGQKAANVVDLRTAESVGTISLPDLPPNDQDAAFVIQVSPGGRYIAAVRYSMYAAKPGTTEKAYMEGPFRLRDSTTGKEVLAFDCTSGSIHFTADASRVLVLDSYNRARWFKLPGGEADGEWKFGDRTSGLALMHVEASSWDGKVLLCRGTVRGQNNTHFILNGQTGEVTAILAEKYMTYSGQLSADGRLATIIDHPQNTRDVFLVVFDVAKGTEVARKRLPEFKSPQLRTALSPDGRQAAVAGNWQDGEAAYVYELAKPAPAVAVKPKDPVPPREPVVLKEKWSSPVSMFQAIGMQTDTANTLVVLGSGEGAAALDMRTGAPKKEFATTLLASKPHELYPLEKGRFATLTPKRDDFEVWDPKTGKVSERLTVPSIPAGPPEAAGVKAVLSPNQKYVAIGRTSGIPAQNHPEVPFRVFDAATRKAIVTTDWHGGAIHFTADSSRVLVSEWNGKARWFKLPSGEEDGGWDFSQLKAGWASIAHCISADGKYVGYTGPGFVSLPGGGKQFKRVFGVLAGKNGATVGTFDDDYTGTFVSLSADGKRAALVKTPPDGEKVLWTTDVVDLTNGAVLAQAKFESSRTIPVGFLTPDGNALVIHDLGGRKAYWFDVIDHEDVAGPKPNDKGHRGEEVIEVEVAKGVKMKLCWIPPGEAQLGSTEAERNVVKKSAKAGRLIANWEKEEAEEVRGKFKTKGFWLGKYEVTQEEWQAVMGENPSFWVPTPDTKLTYLQGIKDSSRFPVEKVSWDDCQLFMKKLNETVKVPARMGMGKFALPHEDQWEYAARGGKGNAQAFYFGDSVDHKSANIFSTFPGEETTTEVRRPKQVGSYEKVAPHPWGLCDMAGGVAEWCDNLYLPGTGDTARIIRGGSYGFDGWGARSAARIRFDHNRQESTVGLRVCFVPE
jgi:formylglycine-generating enzyme required for sulfatase activity